MALGRFIVPVDRESTPSIIARKLREAIAHCELAPGAQLVETELARQLGVSRGPLREAMQRLTQEGLVISIRNRGLFVIELTDRDIHDIYRARAAVERAAAAEIFRRDPVAAGQRLSLISKSIAQVSDRQDRAEIGAADLKFHETLVHLAESPRLSRMHHTLLTETLMCVNALSPTYPSPDIRALEHGEMADAFRYGDAALADRLIIEHMRDAVARLTTRTSTV